MIVMKFGGTSVEDAKAIDRTASIVKGRAAKKPVVVVSAMAKVTDTLLRWRRRREMGIGRGRWACRAVCANGTTTPRENSWEPASSPDFTANWKRNSTR